MGQSVGAGSGGGIHPGAPVIWPTGKSSPTSSVTSTSQAEVTGQTQTSVSTSQSSASSSSSATASSAASSSAASAASASAPTAASYSRAISAADLASQLLSMGMQPNTETKSLATKMLQQGLELSHENFNTLLQIMRTKPDGTATTQDAAVQTLIKGLEGDNQAFQTLANQFARNGQIGNQAQNLSATMAKLQAALQSGKNVLSPELQGSLAAVLAKYDEGLNRQLKNSSSLTDPAALAKLLAKSAGISDAQSLQDLLNGLLQQMKQNGQLSSPDGRQIGRAMRDASNSAQEVQENITSQAILSKESPRVDNMLNEKYLYWQLPNPMANPPGTMELLVKRDNEKEGGPVNKSKTRVIIKLETEALGEITIVIDVQENKVWYTFNADHEEVKDFINRNNKDLRDRMEKISYNLVGFQSIKKKVNIKQYITPMLDLDKITRVRTEI